MKIVHAVCTDAFAGVERHIALLASAQHDAGHNVVVVGGNPSAMVTAMAREDVQHVPGTSVTQVARQISNHPDADVIAVHMTAAEIAAALAVPSRSVPVVTTRHFAGKRGTSSTTAHLVASQAARRISRQIAVSRYVADCIEGDAVVVHSGVPPQPLLRTDPEHAPRVLVAQRLEREKATDLAVMAFAKSGLSRQGWTMDIAGEGSERSHLEALAVQLGIHQAVNFLGHRKDVQVLMHASSLVLAPCPIEALGLTVLEAMSVGIPVLAAGGGGHLETVGSVAPELCFPPGDVGAAASTLRGAAADPLWLQRMGVELRERQQAEFTIQAQAHATEAVYRSVI
jgi:glycosyltransferase involved in cell wall biosynthesis